MNLVTIDQARLHCKADGDDDDLITLYGNAAESACMSLANRYIYPDADALATAKALAVASQTAAWATYDAAVVLANGASDVRVKDAMTENARWELQAVLDDAEKTLNGIVANDEVRSDILGAVLLTIGTLYENKADIVSGQGAAAVMLPTSAANIMFMHRYQGRLAL
jgi:hypothetical protein